MLDRVQASELILADTGRPARELESIVSANAYLGAELIRDAPAGGADVVITGRVADPSLMLAPLEHEFGWQPDDWPRLGAGITVGHMLECST